jgi:hypothetical protein
MVIVRQAGWPSLIVTSRTAKSWPRPTPRWFRDYVRIHLVAGKPAGTDGSQPKAARVGLGLVALVVLTSSAVAWVSVWWVPAYLALMVLIFVTPPRHRQPVLRRERGKVSANVAVSDFANNLRVDQAAEGEQLPLAVEWTSVLSVDESSTESADICTDLTSSGGTKPRRSRSRARKMAKSAIEQVPKFAPATWVQVGPGKFVRADTLVYSVGKANTDDSSADQRPVTDASAEVPNALTASAIMQQEQLPIEPLEVTPEDEGIALASDDGVQRSVTRVHGITPSAFGPAPPVSISVEGLEDDRSGVNIEPGTDAVPVEDLNVKALWPAMGLGYRGSQGRASKNRVCRVSRGLPSSMLDMDRASSQRNVRNRLRLRTLVRSSFVPNTRFRQAACHAFGQLRHIERALRPRSPPDGQSLLENQHSISIAEEPVPTTNGLYVGGSGQFKTREGTDQDKQAAAGQMEISEQGVKPVEDVAWLNEKLDFA